MASTAYGGAFIGFANFVEFTNIIAGVVVLVFFLLISALRLSDYLTSRAAGIPTKTT
jgi:hypothetical protein